MLRDVLLAFVVPMLLTIFMPGVRWFIAAVTLLFAAIGWQNWAFFQTAQSPDFIGPPALPIGEGAVEPALAGLLIGTLARGSTLALGASGIAASWRVQAGIFALAIAVVGALYQTGVVHLIASAIP